jgi:hypothetical protein
LTASRRRAGLLAKLIALFSEPVGDAYVDFLEALGIASIWRNSTGWSASQTAVADDLQV